MHSQVLLSTIHVQIGTLDRCCEHQRTHLLHARYRMCICAIYIHVYMLIFMYIFICMHVYIYIYMYVCIYIYMHICMDVYICVCVCVCVCDSWSLSHLGYLYPGTTPVVIKLDHNRSCSWVQIAQVTKAPTTITKGRIRGRSPNSIDPSCTHGSTISNITCFQQAIFVPLLEA